jgi:hypothetical protein
VNRSAGHQNWFRWFCGPEKTEGSWRLRGFRFGTWWVGGKICGRDQWRGFRRSGVTGWQRHG